MKQANPSEIIGDIIELRKMFITGKSMVEKIIADGALQKFQAAHPGETDETEESLMSDFDRGITQCVPLTNVILSHQKDWNWFDAGEFSQIYDIMKYEDLVTTDESERLPYPYTLVTVRAERTDDDPLNGFLLAMFAFETEKENLPGTIGSPGDGSFSIICASHKNKSEKGWVLFQDIMNVSKHNGKWSFLCFRANSHTPLKDIERFADVPFKMMLTMLKVLRCKNVYVDKERFPDALQKKRMSRGYVRGYDKHTLRIHSNQSEIDRNHLGGTHASPRLHLRRGHIRRLPRANIWVREHMVGSPHGLIEKDYAVKT